MRTLCRLPSLSTTAHNGLQDWRASVMTASAYDEVVVGLPDLHAYATSAHIHRVTQSLMLLQRPVWVEVKSLFPEFDSLPTQQAFDNYLQTILTEVDAMWSAIPATLRRFVKGICFDHIDFTRVFGAVASDPDATSILRSMDSAYVNKQIAAARKYNLPAMLVSDRIGDVFGNVYRRPNENIWVARWPTLLGCDSSLVDWIVARDLFYAPATNSLGYLQPGASEDFAFNGVGSFERFFESWPIMRRQQSDNLCIGILQHIDTSASSGDGSLGPALTTQQRAFVKGLATFVQMLDIDAFGVECLGGNFLASAEIVHSRYTLPVRSGESRVFSANGAIYADYMSSGSPVRIVTSQLFNGFAVYRQL
jgi:hypothetical protein